MLEKQFPKHFQKPKPTGARAARNSDPHCLETTDAAVASILEQQREQIQRKQGLEEASQESWRHWQDLYLAPREDAGAPASSSEAQGLVASHAGYGFDVPYFSLKDGACIRPDEEISSSQAKLERARASMAAVKRQPERVETSAAGAGCGDSGSGVRQAAMLEGGSVGIGSAPSALQLNPSIEEEDDPLLNTDMAASGRAQGFCIVLLHPHTPSVMLRYPQSRTRDRHFRPRRPETKGPAVTFSFATDDPGRRNQLCCTV
eukprot:2757725-Prymnesium_polylepis.1